MIGARHGSINKPTWLTDTVKASEDKYVAMLLGRSVGKLDVDEVKEAIAPVRVRVEALEPLLPCCRLSGGNARPGMHKAQLIVSTAPCHWQVAMRGLAFPPPGSDGVVHISSMKINWLGSPGEGTLGSPVFVDSLVTAAMSVDQTPTRTSKWVQ